MRTKVKNLNPMQDPSLITLSKNEKYVTQFDERFFMPLSTRRVVVSSERSGNVLTLIKK